MQARASLRAGLPKLLKAKLITRPDNILIDDMYQEHVLHRDIIPVI